MKFIIINVNPLLNVQLRIYHIYYFKYSIDPVFPETKQALVTCIQQRKCSTFRPWDQLHDYHFNEWYSSSYSKPLTPVHCFKGNTQEPWVDSYIDIIE